MPKPDYGSRVDVFRRRAECSPEPVASLQGVTLTHAVRTIMQDWPLQHRRDALIATEREFLRLTDIRAIFTEARPVSGFARSDPF